MSLLNVAEKLGKHSDEVVYVTSNSEMTAQHAISEVPPSLPADAASTLPVWVFVVGAVVIIGIFALKIYLHFKMKN